MPIIPRLDRVMADSKMSVNELSQRIDISPVNISRMRPRSHQGRAFLHDGAHLRSAPVPAGRPV